ncbi:MAG: HU family DNA-binding protein [Tannerellaceae bacterium]|jgi:predicted histone-like DNA-binding protein|nr:HU family DNA-binding protein [Tannerellaceae bacterium]
MTAHYNLFRNPSPEKAGEKKNDRIHARLVNQNVVRIDRISKEISEFSSFSAADIKGLLASFQHLLILHLENGEIVELEGLGTFNVSLKSVPATTEKAVTPSKVQFGKVVFRCSKGLRKKLQDMKFERADEGSRLKGYPEEKRKSNILAYLETHFTISSAGCCWLNGCTKYMALKDLKALQKEGKITRLGTRSNAQYAAAEEDL